MKSIFWISYINVINFRGVFGYITLEMVSFPDPT